MSLNNNVSYEISFVSASKGRSPLLLLEDNQIVRKLVCAGTERVRYQAWVDLGGGKESDYLAVHPEKSIGNCFP